MDHPAFYRTRIFRRTGKHSFAVQLQGTPGVVEAHCIDEDWGYMASTWRSAQDLEDRLCAIGTRSMFSWDATVQRVVPSRANTVIGWEEGVEIALGPYDPGRRAFVQCMIRVAQVASPAEAGASRVLVAEKGQVPIAADPVAIAEQSCSKRVFKWMSWGE